MNISEIGNNEFNTRFLRELQEIREHQEVIGILEAKIRFLANIFKKGVENDKNRYLKFIFL